MLEARLHANAKLEKLQNVFVFMQDATKQAVKRLFPVFSPAWGQDQGALRSS